MSNRVSKHRELGVVMDWIGYNSIELTNINHALANNGVITNNASNLCSVLSCVGCEPGSVVQLTDLKLTEYFDSGSAVSAAVRIHFFSRDFTLAARGSAFKVPIDDDHYLGYVDIASAEYVALDNDATSTNRFSFVQKTIHNPNDCADGMGQWFKLEDGSNKLYTCTESKQGTGTYAANATLLQRFTFKSA